MIDTSQPLEIEDSSNTSRSTGYLRLISVLRWTIALFIPVLLMFISVRLVMTEQFLQFEYHRPGFPTDTYGFTMSDRLMFAPYALRYLLNDEGITYLSSLDFADGTSLFNERELQHMADVKVVTRTAFDVMFLGLILMAALLVFAWRVRSFRGVVRQGIASGSILTLVIIFTVVVAAIFTWDTFFTTFHNLFFESGTWRFAYSDTLIRLFPEQFWFDASLVIGGLTSVFAIALLAAARFVVETGSSSIENGV
jgi:integral membrane protein (TIGR01906 family)